MGDSEVETLLPERKLNKAKVGAVASLLGLVLLTGCIYATAAVHPAAGQRGGQFRGSEVIQEIESWTQPRGFMPCEERVCKETFTGVWGADNCPEKTCKHHRDYWGDRVGRHVEDCAKACLKHTECKYSYVSMQAGWEHSACFFLKSCWGDGWDGKGFHDNNANAWGVVCQAKTKAVGKWLPLQSLIAGHESKLKLTHGVSKSETSQTETVSTSSATYSLFNEANENAFFSATVEGSVSNLFSQEVSTTEQEEFSVTIHPKKGETYLWQWVFDLGKGVKVETKNYALTDGLYEVPKCLPGQNAHGDNSYQKCHSPEFELKNA